MSVNKAMILGFLGKDPETTFSKTGTAMTKFSVATSENWLDKNGQKQERTEWHRIVVWGKLAELCGEYLAKGRQVYVEGKINTECYEKDGKKAYSTQIIADRVEFLTKSGNDGKSTKSDIEPF